MGLCGSRYLGCPFINPLFRIGGVDASTYLQSSWPCGQSFFGGFFVVRPEHDDMSARYIVGSIQGGEMACRQMGYMICLKVGGFTTQCTADDLLDLARMQVNAWPKSGHGCRFFEVTLSSMFQFLSGWAELIFSGAENDPTSKFIAKSNLRADRYLDTSGQRNRQNVSTATDSGQEEAQKSNP